MKKVLIVLFLIISSTTFAGHIVGGEVYYDSIGNDTYRVTFEVYRDCSGGGFDSPLQYTVFTTAGVQFSTYNIPAPVADTLPSAYNDPCVIVPTDICVERANYVDTIVLPATPDGYKIVYQRCCWANGIQNITDPGLWGLTITTDVPGIALVGQADNNCARFVNYPPIVLCLNSTLTFDHIATDIDGDSLVYSMCTPPTVDLGPSGTNNEPNPEYPPPYSGVIWEPGFSGTQPFGAGSNVTIDPQTGMMDITPGLVGKYVAGVCVEEYRNGVLINSKTRTFGYRVVSCEAELPIEISSLIGGGSFIEGCSTAGFILERTNTDSLLTIEILVSGSATNGVDYNLVGSSVTLPIGVASDTISIFPLIDNIPEGDETVIFSFILESSCENGFDTLTVSLTIEDYIPMSIIWGDSTNICDETDEYGLLWCEVQDGLPPYNYTWAPTPYLDSNSISFPATDLEPNLTYMSVNVIDACGQNISSGLIPVYNRCPLQVPNVITMNGDDVNDEFIIGNMEDYDRIRVQIFNRWGNIVYETDNYQNEWKGYDKSGKELEAGVYTYVVTPESDKFEYDDQEKTRYSAHGFVHIIK